MRDDIYKYGLMLGAIGLIFTNTSSAYAAGDSSQMLTKLFLEGSVVLFIATVVIGMCLLVIKKSEYRIPVVIILVLGAGYKGLKHQLGGNLFGAPNYQKIADQLLENKWLATDSPGKHYRVLLPGKPVLNDEIIEGQDGFKMQIKMHMHKSEKADMIFAAGEVVAAPVETTKPTVGPPAPEYFLDGMSAIKLAPEHLTKEHPGLRRLGDIVYVTKHGLHGSKAEYTGKLTAKMTIDARLHSRWYWDSDQKKIYVLQMACREEFAKKHPDLFEKLKDKYYDSLELADRPVNVKPKTTAATVVVKPVIPKPQVVPPGHMDPAIVPDAILPGKSVLKESRSLLGGGSVDLLDLPHLRVYEHVAVWDTSGEALFVVGSMGIRRISYPDYVETHQLPKGLFTRIAISSRGLLVSLFDAKEIWLVSPKDLKVHRRYKMPGNVHRVLCHPDLNYAIVSLGVEATKGAVHRLDLETGEITESTWVCRRLAQLSPKGDMYFAFDSNQPVAYRLNTDGSLEEVQKLAQEGTQVLKTHISQDGNYLAAVIKDPRFRDNGGISVWDTSGHRLTKKWEFNAGKSQLKIAIHDPTGRVFSIGTALPLAVSDISRPSQHFFQILKDQLPIRPDVAVVHPHGDAIVISGQRQDFAVIRLPKDIGKVN